MDTNRLKLLAISDTGFVFDPRTGHSYTVNPTGLTVLRELQRGTPPRRIAERLSADFDGTGSVAADVEAFVELLRDHDLVGDAEQRGAP